MTKEEAVHPLFRRSTDRQHGMSLVEIMVAMTVFVIAMTVSLILYNMLANSAKRGGNAVNQQQSTRHAFDKMVTDLLLAGYNYNPDGSPNRPDEQIEGAWDTAISIRADLDLKDAALSIDPEASLAGGSEIVISTGNDEIITYALAKPDGTGGQTLSFIADVQGVPRDGIVETVSVSNLALVQDDPPYTLYRITVQPNSTAVTRTPVAEGIYSLRFRYFDSASTPLGPDTPADFSDDIGGADTVAAKLSRESIARIQMEVVGLTDDPDLLYTDSSDPYPATQKHRKFRLLQDVTPRNLGFIGLADTDSIPPNQPVNLLACPGQCQSALLTWDAPSADELVRQWVTVQGDSPSLLGTPKTFSTNMAFIDDLTEGLGYYFRVRSEDSSGNVSPLSELATPEPANIADTTTPEATLLLQASGGGTGPAAEDELIHITWDPVTTNVEAVGCDPEPYKIRDLLGYRLYRSESSGTIATPAFAYLEPGWLTANKSETTDSNVVACRTYYYDIRAVDKCGNESASQATPTEGQTTTQHRPAKVTGLQASPFGTDGMNLQWDKVTTNTSGDFTLVDRYRIYRAELPSSMLPALVESAITWENALYISSILVSDVNLPTYVDNTALVSDPANSFYYRVSALTDCAEPFDEGELSSPNEGVDCNMEVTIGLIPEDGASVTGIVSIGLSAVPVDPLETFTGFVVISDAVGGTVASFGTGANPLSLPLSDSWDTTAIAQGQYTITATVINSTACSETVSHTVDVLSPATCCIAPQSPVLGPQTGKLSLRLSDLLFNVVNNCGQDLEVTGFNAAWTNIIGNHHVGSFCYDVPADVNPEDCDPLLTFVPAQSSPVSHEFATPLVFGADRTDMNPLVMGFQFDLPLATTDPELGETLTVDLFYQLTGVPSPAQCNILIHTNPLDIGTSEP